MKKRGENNYTVRIKENKEGSIGLPVKKNITGEELVLLEKGALNVFSQSKNIESGGLGRVSSLRDVFETSQSSQIWDFVLKKELESSIVPEYKEEFIVTELSEDDSLEDDNTLFSAWDNPYYTLNDIRSLSSVEYKPNGDEFILLGSSDKNLLYKDYDKVNNSHTFATTITNAIENYNIDDELFDVNYNEHLISLSANNILSDIQIIDRLDEDVWLISLKLNLNKDSKSPLNRFDKSLFEFSKEYLDSDDYKGFAITSSIDSTPDEQSSEFRLYDWDYLDGNSVFDLKIKSSDSVYIWYGTKNNWIPISYLNMSDVIDKDTPSSYFANVNSSDYNRVFVCKKTNNEINIIINNKNGMKWLDRDLYIDPDDPISIPDLSNIDAYRDDLIVDKFIVEDVMIFNPRVHQIGYDESDIDVGYGRFSSLNELRKSLLLKNISIEENLLHFVCRGHLEIGNKKGYMVFKNAVTINTL